MFHHTVHFWLKPDATPQRTAAFIAGLKSLGDSPHVASVRVGVPAGTPREVVDNSYTVQLLCTFNSRADHDAYQSPDDAAHTAFINAFKHDWQRVVIYDSVEA